MRKAVVVQITDALGIDVICRRLDVSASSVRAARTKGLFPALWFNEIETMCAEAGLQCPRDVFYWKVSEEQA